MVTQNEKENVIIHPDDNLHIIIQLADNKNVQKNVIVEPDENIDVTNQPNDNIFISSTYVAKMVIYFEVLRRTRMFVLQNSVRLLGNVLAKDFL